MRIFLFIIFIFINLTVFSQSPGTYPRILSRVHKSEGENEVKVKDVKVATCAPDNCHSYLYPVLIENFDNNYDLPNKWKFDLGYTRDDNVSGCNENECYATWFGYGYFNENGQITNNNVKVDNGILKLVIKDENVTAEPSENAGLKDYKFTSGMIQTLSRFEYGTFEASIKIPNANKLWPAYWLLNKLGNYSEIDIFEFYDDEVDATNCDDYNHHTMSLHVGDAPNENEFIRSDKYPMSNIDAYHIYKLEWNKYEVQIFVDGQKKGYATRYYDRQDLDSYCNYGTSWNIYDPKFSYNCSTLQGLEDNWFEVWWPQKPPGWPKWLWWPSIPKSVYYPNTIRQDSWFPSRDRPMALIINNTLNRAYKGHGLSADFSEASRTMLIDWVKVYQPFCCNEDKTVFTMADLNYLTSSTQILTGRKLKFGNQNTCQFSQNYPNSTNWDDIPVILLATEEIEINGDASFPGETYAEMRITDCNGAFRLQNPADDSGIKNDVDIEPVPEDSNAKRQSQNTDTLLFNQPNNDKNDFIQIYPVPSSNEITLKCDDAIFEKIATLTLVDVNNIKHDIKKTHTINLEPFNAGCYQLMIIFIDNTMVNKRIIKL